MPRFPRTVVLLGVVSLLTDASSEMIYPLLPAFLAGVLALGRAAPAALGLIEGVAESTAAALKIASGVWSDRMRRRTPLVYAGYTLSSLVRPLIGLAATWPVVLLLRFLDRVGKGLRTSPRDALIAEVADPARRGAAFGLHRAMDHAGALIGPLIAAALLKLEGVELPHVFLLAAIPAAGALAVLYLGVREPKRPATAPANAGPRPRPTIGGLRALTPEFRRFLLAMLVFTLGNSSDAFLLLRLGDAGVEPAWIALLWSAHHAVKMGATYYGGAISDRVGRRPMLVAGWVLYAAVYLAFALVSSTGAMIAVFLVYGVYFGLAEPVERGWVSDLAPPDLRGTAFGWHHLVVGLGALPASALFGLLWRYAGATAPFLVGGGLALVACAMLWRVPDAPPAASR